MAVGLRNTATIKIKLDFDDSKVAGLKDVLSSAMGAMNATALARGMGSLENTVTGINRALDRLAKTYDKGTTAAKAQGRAGKAAADAQKKGAEAAVRAEVVKVHALNKTAAGMRMLDQMSEGATNRLVAGWTKMRNAAVGAAQTTNRAMKTFVATENDATRATRGLQAGLQKIATQGLAAVTKATKEDERATRGLIAGWNKIQSESREFNLELRKLASAFDGLGKRSKKFDQDNRGLIATIKQAVSLATKHGQASGVTARMLRQLSYQLEIAAQKQEDHNRAMKGSLGTFESLKYRLTYFEQQMDAIFRASFRMQMVGHNLQQFARDIFRVGSQMMTTFGDFEYMMNRAAGALQIWEDATVGAVVGVDKLQEGLLNLSINMKLIPAKDVAEAMYYWGSATGSAVSSQEDLNRELTALEPIMKAAIMTNMGYETAIKGVYSIITQYYNGAVGMAGMVTEQLFYVTQKTAVEFEDLINSFKMVGPVARANNVTFQEMVDLFGRLGDLGVRGTMAGRAFRQLFIQLVKPSGPAKKAIASLFSDLQGDTRDIVAPLQGKSYFDLVFPEGEFVGVKKYIEILARATADLSTYDRNSFLAKITTANELPVLTALIVDTQRALKGLDSTTKSSLSLAQEAAIYFEKNWNRLSGSWNATIGQMQRLWDALVIQVGSIVAKVLEPLITKIGEVIDAMREWASDPANKQIIETLATIAAVAGALSALGGVILTVGGSLMGLVAVLYVVGKSFARVMLPVAALGGAIVALVDAIVRNFDIVQDALQDTADAFSEAFGSAEDAGADMMALFDSMMAPVRTIFDLIVQGGVLLIKTFNGLVRVLGMLNQHVPILEALASAIGVLVASRTLMFLGTLAARILGITFVMKALRSSMMGGRLGLAGLVVGDVVAAQKSIGGLRGAITGIRGAITSVVGLVGRGGIAGLILGAGFLAYETNMLGFRDMIDHLTAGFRDLNKELDELKTKWGDIDNLGERMRKSTESMAEIIAQRGIGVQEIPYDPQNLLVTFQGSGKQTIPRFDTRDPRYQEAIDEVAAGIVAEQTIIIEQGFLRASEEINKTMAGIGVEGYVDSQIYGETLLKLTEAITDPKALETAASHILISQRQYGYSADTVRSIYDGLVSTIPELAEKGWDWFFKNFYNKNAEAAALAAANAKSLDDIYAPIIDKIQAARASGASDEYIAALFGEEQTRFTRINGEILAEKILPVTDILSQLTPELQERAASLMSSIGMSADDFMESGEVGDAIHAIYEAMGQELAGISGLAMSEGYLTTVNEVTGPWNKMVQDIAKGSADSMAAAFGTFKSVFVPLIQSSDLPGVLQEALKAAGDLFVQQGLIGASELEAMLKPVAEAVEEVVAKTRTEWISAFTSGLGSREGFAKDIKDALSGKNSNKRSLGRLLSDFLSDDLKRGLRGNMQSAEIARTWITNNIDAIVGMINGATSKNRQKIINQITKWFNIKKEDLPDKVLQPISGLVGQLQSEWAGDAPLTPSNPFKGKGKGKGAGPFQRFVTNANNAKATVGNVMGAVKTVASDTLTALGGMKWREGGQEAGQKWGEGLGAGVWLFETGTSEAEKAKNAMFNDVAWWSGGQKAGAAWASGLNSAILQNVDRTLSFVASVSIGTSPPKSGPLKDIDKGGFNVGKAWADGIRKGAEYRMRKDFSGLSKTEISMNNERTLKVEVDIKSDSKVSREAASEIRRGIYEGLVDGSMLNHMVTIR